MSTQNINAKAVCIVEPGGPEALQLGTIVVPAPGPGQVRVEVRGSGLNRADVLQRRGFYPPPPGVPHRCRALNRGRRGSHRGRRPWVQRRGSRHGHRRCGAMATHLVTSERELLPIPESIDDTQAAAIPEAFLTAFDALFANGKLRLGELLLIHAVGSGVGTAALQLGKRAGAFVVGTSRSQEKLTRCTGLGLDVGVLSADGAFEEHYFKETKVDAQTSSSTSWAPHTYNRT